MGLGPDPLSRQFTFRLFKKRLFKKPRGKIKQVLMDQSIVAGIGNIYSDEMLWRADIHPLSFTSRIPEQELKKLYRAGLGVLQKGIVLAAIPIRIIETSTENRENFKTNTTSIAERANNV